VVKGNAASASKRFVVWASNKRIDVWALNWCTTCPPTLHSVGAFVVVAAAPDVKRSAVLILSEDPLAAALIGAAVELTGLEPTFPAAQDQPREALLRERPGLVLLDCDHATCGPNFVGPAMMTGARVILVTSGRNRGDGGSVASQFGLRSLALPADVAAIAEALRAELEAAGR
jgi:hypothetical protein